MNVFEIVADWLKEHGCDGLAGDECGCTLDEIMPCEVPNHDCVAGIKAPIPAEYKDELVLVSDFWMVPKQMEKQVNEHLVTLTSAERDLLIHGIQFTHGEGCTWPEEWPLIEPLLKKLGYEETTYEDIHHTEGEKIDEH